MSSVMGPYIDEMIQLRVPSSMLPTLDSDQPDMSSSSSIVTGMFNGRLEDQRSRASLMMSE